MMERRQVVRAWSAGDASALVTLIRVEGSSYRRPGARLLVRGQAAAGHVATGQAASGGQAPSGQTGPAGDATSAGSISGGCLETELVRRAAWKVRSGALVERYAMTFDDTAEIPFGLGCGGTVELLLEPVDTPEAKALLAALGRSLEGRASTVVSFLPDEGRTLRRLVLGPDGEVVFASEALGEAKIACARLLAPGQEYEGRFVERLAAPQRLVLLGAGEDAKPLVRMAAMLGWTVIVADGRAHLARAERFPEAHAVHCTSTAAALGLGSDDAVVLMSHSYEQDGLWLAEAIPARPRYLGLLGSRHRSSLLIDEASERLGLPVARCCEGVFAPVGLNLGGDGAEAIALAVVSEVQALIEGRLRTGQLESSRRLTAEEVERQLALGGVPVYRRQPCQVQVPAG